MWLDATVACESVALSASYRVGAACASDGIRATNPVPNAVTANATSRARDLRLVTGVSLQGVSRFWRLPATTNEW